MSGDATERPISPEMICPVRAENDKSKIGENWLIAWGNSSLDGGDWYLTTDNCRASEVSVRDFPNDAKLDCKFVADLINAYRSGQLVPVNSYDEARALLREAADWLAYAFDFAEEQGYPETAKDFEQSANLIRAFLEKTK